MKSARTLLMLGLSSTLICTGATRTAPIEPIRGLDLSRFMGRWYVIASIPTRYERGGYNPVETYVRNPDGTICTWFRHRPNSFTAPVKLLHSTAKVVPDSGNGEWRVRLFAVLSMQYLVGWLKPDYSQTLVMRDARDYLWYMARTAEVSEVDYQAMLERVKAMGYDVARIEKAPQRWPEAETGNDTFAGECP